MVPTTVMRDFLPYHAGLFTENACIEQSLEDSKNLEGHQMLPKKKEDSENNILISVTLTVLESYWNMFLLSDAFQFPGDRLPFQKEC